MNKKIVLHVGCGPRHPEALHPFFKSQEWNEVRLDINPAVKPDIVSSITDMQAVADESVSAIWSSHNLEHLFAHEVPVALREFFRVLKPDGFALIRLPDIQAVAREVAKGDLEQVLYHSPAGPISSIDIIWGLRAAIADGNHFMAHKTGFTAKTLKQKLLDAGFYEVQIKRQGLDMVVSANKKNASRTQGFQKELDSRPDLVEALYHLGDTFLDQGDWADAMSCYQKLLLLQPDNVDVHYNLGITFFEQHKLDEAIACYQNALTLNPDMVEAHYNMAIAYQELGNFDEAITCYQKAIQLKPDFAEASNNLGIVFQEQGNFAQAILCFQKALAIKPHYADAYYNLGKTFHDQHQYDNAISCYRKALDIRPDYFKACNNLAKTLQEQRRLDEAILWYQKALRIKPNYVEARFNLSTVQLLIGNFPQGWSGYELRFKRREWQKTYPHRFGTPRWTGEPFPGKRLYVHSEQGLGDILQFVRYLPMVKARGGTVIFETIKPLMKLFEDLEGVDELVDVSQRPCADEFDCYVPLLSLPLIFNTTLDTIPAKVPYLCAAESKVQQWKGRLSAAGIKVGLVWAGTIADPKRSLPLAWFTTISQIAGLHLYGLQKGISAEQVEVEGLPDGMEMTNFGQEFEDFTDTAAVIENLDLVLSIDTSVAHLAGAMGKPVWLLLPFVPDWRWLLDRKDSPWYPTMRLFRQQRPGGWDNVIRQTTAELQQLVGRRQEKI